VVCFSAGMLQLPWELPLIKTPHQVKQKMMPPTTMISTYYNPFIYMGYIKKHHSTSTTTYSIKIHNQNLQTKPQIKIAEDLITSQPINL
jgi:hypothetical protein